MKAASRTQHTGQAAGRVPSIDLAATYADLKPEIDAAVTRVLASGRFIGGPEVEGLESEFAAFCGVPHAVSVASGTDALRFALLAAGLPAGIAAGFPAGRPAELPARPPAGLPAVPPATSDGRVEVITSPLTFVATTEAITQAGGRTVFVDVDEESLTLDPDLVRKALTPKTAAIIPVHLYGQIADMQPILEMARGRGVAIVEDACQAHGAQYRGGGSAGRAGAAVAAGAIGDVGCFSFYPTKNMGGCGEGGMLVTRSPEIAARVGRLRDHGQSEKYVHPEEGYNGRLDALQAAILRVKLRRLSGWNARRRALAALYGQRLKELGLAEAEGPGKGRSGGAPLRLPVEKPWGVHVYHLYSVRVVGRASRDRVRAALADRGIDTGIHYPIPLHLQACYSGMGLGAGSFPVAERAAREVLSLPLYPEMSDDQVIRVCEALRDVLRPE